MNSKQGVVSHNISLTPLTGNLTHKTTSSFLFPLINPFSSFSSKVFSASEASVISPNSTSDFFSIRNPLFSTRNPRTCLNKTSRIKHCLSGGRDSEPTGLAIVDAISNEKAEKASSAENRIVLQGSHLKVQIPSIDQNSSYRAQLVESPHPPIKFGLKTKNSQLDMALHSPGRGSSLAFTTPTSMENSPRALHLSASEIELSEDYTCVISHGPQQKTTHIFDNFIIESCSNGISSLREMKFSADQIGGYTSDYFLAFCHTCRNKIAQGNDIFICRYNFDPLCFQSTLVAQSLLDNFKFKFN